MVGAVIGIITGLVVVLVVVISVFWDEYIRPIVAERRAAQEAARARRQVGDLFDQARIRMEEAAGQREPGEQRISDAIRGSWERW